MAHISQAAPTVEPDWEGNRELLLTYLGEKEPVLFLDGLTTDHGALQIFCTVWSRESDAWLLHKLGLLPTWWRLVSSVSVHNLMHLPDEEMEPEPDAIMRLADLSEPERDALRYGWRVQRTSNGGGRITRRVDRRRPIEADPLLVMSLDRIERPVLGPMHVWPNVEIEPVLVDSR